MSDRDFHQIRPLWQANFFRQNRVSRAAREIARLYGVGDYVERCCGNIRQNSNRGDTGRAEFQCDASCGAPFQWLTAAPPVLDTTAMIVRDREPVK